MAMECDSWLSGRASHGEARRGHFLLQVRRRYAALQAHKRKVTALNFWTYTPALRPTTTINQSTSRAYLLALLPTRTQARITLPPSFTTSVQSKRWNVS